MAQESRFRIDPLFTVVDSYLPSGRFLAIAVLLLVTGAAQAQVERPLLQEGKSALYQRVIAVPGAVLAEQRGKPDEGRAVPPFSTFYVYARSDDAEGRAWLEVGPDSVGPPGGWIAADQTIDWRQTLTVSFRDPQEHERVLLFSDRDALRTLIDENDAETYRRLREEAAAGNTADSPVVAIQPERHIDIRREFYLIPILDHEDVLVSGQQGRLLRVATVPLQDTADIVAAYRTGIVFVIDSTISMGPYIERTNEVMQEVYASIDAARLSDRVSFGLVAYRDNTTAVPGLQYVTRTYADLADGERTDEFLTRIREVQPAPVSSDPAAINRLLRWTRLNSSSKDTL